MAVPVLTTEAAELVWRVLTSAGSRRSSWVFDDDESDGLSGTPAAYGWPSIYTLNFVNLSILDDDDNGVEPRSISARAGMASKFQGSARRQCNTRP